MSHSLYKTDAFVLGSTNFGEGHRSIDLLTRDFGRVHGVARSVRYERSKLRYALQDFSLVTVSLVRGREVWRVVGANESANMFFVLRGRVWEQEMLARIAALLRRLLPGEEANTELFTVIEETTRFLETTTPNTEALRNLECLIVLRVLYNLGYLAKDTLTESLVNVPHINDESIAELSPLRYNLIQKINMSLQESQL